MSLGKKSINAIVMRYLVPVILVTVLMQYSSCSDETQTPKKDPNDPSKLDWLIPRAQIINRGIKSDSLPPISSPAFMSGTQVN